MVLVDDHAVVRGGLGALLADDPELVVAGEASGSSDALPLIIKVKPDVVLLDLNLRHADGLELAKQIVREHAETKVAILSIEDDPSRIWSALRVGARGYFLKSDDVETILSGTKAVARGNVFYTAGVARSVLSLGPWNDGSIDGLTTKQQKLLQLIALGLANKQIAYELSVSLRTVESYRKQLKAKLGLKTSADFARFALEQGLLN